MEQLLYRLNCTPSSLGGSFLWFFDHLGRVEFITSVSQKFSIEDVQMFRTKHKQAQDRVAEERRKSNRDEFMPGDPVRITDVGKATWSQEGDMCYGARRCE